MYHVYFQDSNDHLWIGADNEGVYELDAKGKRLRHYQPGNAARSVASTIMCIYEDTDKTYGLVLIRVGLLSSIGEPGIVNIFCLLMMKVYFQ